MTKDWTTKTCSNKHKMPQVTTTVAHYCIFLQAMQLSKSVACSAECKPFARVQSAHVTWFEFHTAAAHTHTHC
jgi:hypothetical protein